MIGLSPKFKFVIAWRSKVLLVMYPQTQKTIYIGYNMKKLTTGTMTGIGVGVGVAVGVALDDYAVGFGIGIAIVIVMKLMSK